jgi:uncharacterized protein with HEPN domain
MTRVYLDYLQDMLDNARRAVQFVKGMDYKKFSKDDKTVYAVIRAVEIIGEAAASVPDEIRSKYPDIPWRDVKGMRNKLVHQYFGINMEVVWQTVQEDLPMLMPILENILKQEHAKKNK